MSVFKIIIEFLITFAFIFGIYCYSLRKIKKGKKDVSQEVSIILAIYKIDSKKIKIQQMNYVVAIFTSLVLAFSITYVGEISHQLALSLFLAMIISAVSITIIYTIIGRHYYNKSKKVVNKR